MERRRRIRETKPYATESSRRSLLQRIRELPAAIQGSAAALALTTEVTAAEAAFPPPPADEYAVISNSEYLPPVPTITFERDHVMIGNGEAGFFIQHNFHTPESLADIGKMFVEPLSFGLTFNADRDNIVTKVLTGSDTTPFVFQADIPYEYARDFNTASAVDQQKMEEDMTRKAQALIEQILPEVFGVSFHKDEVQDIGGAGAVRVSEVTIDGFASPESDIGIGMNDPRNKRLSDMRAENAAYVLQRVFKDKDVDVTEIKYRGQGELPLTSPEREQLMQDAYEIKIGPDGPEDQHLLELVRQYNNGTITEEEVKRSVEQIIGEKRKVAVTVITDERSYVLIFPLPIFLPLAVRLLSRLFDRDRFPGGRPGNAVYAEFTPGLGAQDQARQVGRNIRQNYRDPGDLVQPRRDVVKGYAGTSQPVVEYRDEVVRAARHWRKREGRQRVQLEFQQGMPLPERVSALAFLVDRYLRMTPRLMSERNILGQLNNRDYDFMNIYEDREALQELVHRIARTDVYPLGGLAQLPEPNIPGNGQVRFQFAGGLNRVTTGGVEGRRGRVYTAFVWVNGVQYQLNRQVLQNLADEYMATHRVIADEERPLE